MAAGELPVEIEEPGKLPAERFKNWSDAQDLCSQMLSADATRAQWRTAVQKLHDGNALYSIDSLRKSGQGWRNRTNFRGLEGLVQTIGTAIYSLDVEVDRCVEIELDYGKGVEKNDWEEAIERNFSWIMLRKWEDFDYHVQMRIQQMVLHGLGCHVNSLNDSWIPRTLRMGSVLFPDDSPVNFHEDGEFFMVRDFITMPMLYEKIRNEKQARELGWNPDVVWKAMAQTSKAVFTGKSFTPEQLQALYKQGDMQYSQTRRGGIWLNYLYVSEYDTGKISLYILPELQNFGGYLFQKRNMFDSWGDILTIFPYDVGNGTIQSIRGIGARTKEYFEMENRLLNAVGDQMLFASTMPMKQTGGELDKDKLRLLKLGVLSILPDGLEPVQGIQFQNIANGLIGLRQELKSGMNENNQAYIGQNPEGRDRQTGLEYSMRAQDASKVNKGVHNLYYRNLTRFYRERLKGICRPQQGNGLAQKLARMFQERCLRDGVPKAALQHIEDVIAVRSVGAGSAAANLQAQLMLRQYIYPTTTKDRQINMDRDLTSALVGYTMTDRYARSQADNDLVDQDMSFAVLENDALVQGGEAAVAERQDQVAHLQIHLGKGEEINNAYLDGQIPAAQSLPALNAIGQHSAAHLETLEGIESRKEEFRILYDRWQKLSKAADRMENELEAQADQAPPQQQISEDAQVKMAKVEIDGQIKAEKAKQAEARAWRKLQFNEGLADARTASSIRRASIK